MDKGASPRTYILSLSQGPAEALAVVKRLQQVPGGSWGPRPKTQHWNRRPQAVKGEGRGRGELGSEVGQLLLCTGDGRGLSFSGGLKLGPNPFCPGCHPWVKITGAAKYTHGGRWNQKSGGTFLSRVRAQDQGSCRVSGVREQTLGPASSQPPATRAKPSAGKLRLASSPGFRCPGGWSHHSRAPSELSLRAERSTVQCMRPSLGVRPP